MKIIKKKLSKKDNKEPLKKLLEPLIGWEQFIEMVYEANLELGIEMDLEDVEAKYENLRGESLEF